MAANQAPNTNEQVNNTEGVPELAQRGDERPPYFEYNRSEREALLREQADTSIARNAVDNVFSSTQWQEQRGELDRFQLAVLYQARQESDGSESFHCRFSGCNYMNKESTNAVEHIRGFHFGNKPFLCSQCNRAFTRRHDRDTHSATHNGTASFQCRYCLSMFTRVANQYRHERNAHPDQYEDPNGPEQDLPTSP